VTSLTAIALGQEVRDPIAIVRRHSLINYYGNHGHLLEENVQVLQRRHHFVEINRLS
jgi:hypothetical protein